MHDRRDFRRRPNRGRPFTQDLTLLEEVLESPDLPKGEHVDKFAGAYGEVLWRAYATGSLVLRELVTVPTSLTHNQDTLEFWRDEREHARLTLKRRILERLADKS